MSSTTFCGTCKLLLGLTLSSAAAIPSSGWAETYPQRPIKLVVPFTPGGVNDSIGRLLAKHLSNRLGQQVIVENRPGAGGQVGTGWAIKQPADGYTLVVGSVDALVMGPAMKRQKAYDALHDATPVALVANSPLIVAASLSFPGKTIIDLVQLARSSSKQISYGTAGVGTSLHLGVELLQSRTGTKMLHVPFQGGTPMMQALASQQIDFVLTSPELAVRYLASGRAKGIAQADIKRHPLLPDIPTADEQGLKDLILTPWFGIVGPANLPSAIVDRLDKEISSIASDADFAHQLIQVGAQVEYMNAPRFKQYIADETTRWSQIIREAQVPVQD